MAYMDIVERNKSVKFEGKFVLDDVYKTIAKWGKNKQYNICENEYATKKDGKLQTLKIRLDVYKKITDYVKIGLFVIVKATDISNIKYKNKNMQEGSILINLTSYVKKDYEDTWTRKTTSRFLRELYERFIVSNRFDKYEEEIGNDLKSLKLCLKDFFRAPAFKK
jgi:hypothetical protein